jgi:DNA mismatch endonuclease (patch repair protein)
MSDIVDSVTRSRMMAGITATNTKPELIIRKLLFSSGFRYRLHNRFLSGTPDIVLKKYRAVIFVNGCFWHGHHCHLFRLPKSRTDFWKKKIRANSERDAHNRKVLAKDGWRVGLVWECAVKGKTAIKHEILLAKISNWLNSSNGSLSVFGRLET